MSNNKNKAPRQYSLVRLVDEIKEWHIANVKDSPLLQDDVFVYLGEIPNMDGWHAHACVGMDSASLQARTCPTANAALSFSPMLR